MQRPVEAEVQSSEVGNKNVGDEVKVGFEVKIGSSGRGRDPEVGSEIEVGSRVRESRLEEIAIMGTRSRSATRGPGLGQRGYSLGTWDVPAL